MANDLHEHVRKLNEQERIQHELRKQAALDKIFKMRQRLKEKECQK